MIFKFGTYKLVTGEWFIDRTSARRRRVLHYWATVLWLTVGLVAWIILRDALWFVGFMSLYAIWITHIAAGRQKRLLKQKPSLQAAPRRQADKRHSQMRNPRKVRAA
jgi:hypothetical protein